mmetsp:Transcript_1513/g.4829  ORF Transcript_1513/g.4829 Transcript_1513/m.4829 type:complete len:204 (+) Transcript_1513:1099-1710(+)
MVVRASCISTRDRLGRATSPRAVTVSDGSAPISTRAGGRGTTCSRRRREPPRSWRTREPDDGRSPLLATRARPSHGCGTAPRRRRALSCGRRRSHGACKRSAPTATGAAWSASRMQNVAATVAHVCDLRGVEIRHIRHCDIDITERRGRTCAIVHVLPIKRRGSPARVPVFIHAIGIGGTACPVCIYMQSRSSGGVTRAGAVP